MIILGIICLILGYVLPVPLLFTIGEVLVLIGIILLLFGYVRGPIAGRRYWY